MAKLTLSLSQADASFSGTRTCSRANWQLWYLPTYCEWSVHAANVRAHSRLYPSQLLQINTSTRLKAAMYLSLVSCLGGSTARIGGRGVKLTRSFGCTSNYTTWVPDWLYSSQPFRRQFKEGSQPDHLTLHTHSLFFLCTVPLS